MVVVAVLDDLLLISSAIFLLAQVYSLRWGHQLLAATPIHAPGGELLRIFMVVVSANVAAQFLTFFNALLIYTDPIATIDTRVALFFVIEVVLASAMVWAMHAVRGLPADSYPDLPSPEGGQRLERVPEEVDDSTS